MRPPERPPPPIQLYSRFAAGDELQSVLEALDVNTKDVRYLESMPEGQMGAVYFLDEGNVRITARKEEGRWVLATTPFLEPSSVPVEQRLEAWDRGADKQQDFGLKSRK